MHYSNNFLISFYDKEAVDSNKVGGKAASLGRLYKYFQKFIPSGHSVNSEYVESILKESNGNIELLIEILNNEKYSSKIKKCFSNETYYAVRSSASGEDGKKHSFAGQHESFLAVKGYKNIIHSIAKCMISYYNNRSVLYKKLKNINTDFSFSVLIQDMILSSKSGVLFTCNPIDRSSNEVIINSSYGLCDLVVEGKIIPDTVKFNKKDNSFNYIIGSKKYMNIITVEGIKRIRVPEIKRKVNSLKEFELKSLINLCLEIEKFFQYPVDIEWAISNNHIYIFQARPITNIKEVI